jgi:hypothetical protein
MFVDATCGEQSESLLSSMHNLLCQKQCHAKGRTVKAEADQPLKIHLLIDNVFSSKQCDLVNTKLIARVTERGVVPERGGVLPRSYSEI